MPDDRLSLVYEQYLTQARHVETEVLTFLSAYVLLAAAALAYIGSQFASNDSQLFVSIALALISVMGLFLTHSWKVPFVIFTRVSEVILVDEFKLGRYRRWFNPEFGGRDQKARTKLFQSGRVVSYFYVLMSSIFVFLLVVSYLHSEPSTTTPGLPAFIASVTSFVDLALIYEWILKPLENKTEQEILEMIRDEEVRAKSHTPQ